MTRPSCRKSVPLRHKNALSISGPGAQTTRCPLGRCAMKKLLVTLALLFLAVVSPLVGQADDETSRATLVGLPGVYVLVETVADEAQRDGLDTLQVRTDVEVKLRQAGIRVLSKEEWLSTAGAPYLYVNIQTAKNNLRLYAVSVSIDLRQDVT